MRAKPGTRNGKNVKTSNSNSNNNSSSGNNSNKLTVKKPLKENVSATKQPDNSVLRPPIETSVAGLKQAVKLFETGTPEVVYLLNYECDVIYECRVCRNLFRSLANFISHKRVYCTRRFNHVQASPLVEDHTILVEDTVGDCGNSLPQRITARQDLTSIMQTSAAKYYKQVEEKLHSRGVNRCDTTVHLQPIETTAFGVYQTVSGAASDKLIKNQVSELNQIITINEGVTLGPDGKILQEGSTPVEENTTEDENFIDDLRCSLCKLKFSSKKTLSHHTKTVHESFRICYSCPCCKNIFSNTWSVHRHLYKVHRKTSEQVRRLRAQIQKKQVRAEKLAKRLSKKVITNKSGKEDNVAWMEQLEDDTQLQRCGGCGRRFERRAALTSHAQICHKRMAACNAVQSNKRKEEKSHELLHDSVSSSSKQQSTPTHKLQSEKKIGIQVRMNYCKNSLTNVVTRRSERHRSCEEKDDDAAETQSLDSSTKDRVMCQSTESINKIKFEHLRGSEENTNSALDGGLNVNTNKTINRSSRSKMKRLENMCSQLRKAVGLEEENKTNFNLLPETSNYQSNNRDRIYESVKSEDSDETNIKLGDHLNKNFCTVKSDIGNGKTLFRKKCDSVSKECGNITVECILSEDLKENSFSRDCVNENSNCTSNLSCTEHTIDESDLSEDFNKVVDRKFTDNNETCNSNDNEETNKVTVTKNHSFVTENAVEKDTIGILTRFKVRSIFKHDNSSVDSSISENSDHEDLSNTDESSLKENLSETHEDDDDEQTNLIHKKMSQYIRYKSKQCLICLKKFKVLLHIKHHVADHLGLNNYHCLFYNCTYSTFSRSECVKHLMKTHLKHEEKHRASGLVGEVGQLKSDHCDINIKKLSKRKNSNKEDIRATPVLKESVGSEMKGVYENSVTVVSINNEDTSEVAREECVQTSKIDSSCSEQSDTIEPTFKQKLKRRKLSGCDKQVTPPIRKCSPDSTTEILETNSKNSAVGAHFRNGKSLSKLISKKSKP